MPQKSKTGASQRKAAKPKKEKTQRVRFIEAARSIGVDETGGEFERTLRVIAPPKRGQKSK
jgi:hypothetical protein